VTTVAGTGPFADNKLCQDFVASMKKMREHCKWTQERLAAESHCTSIANIESFQRAPLVEHGQDIDGAFGLTDMFALKAQTIQLQLQGKPFNEVYESFPLLEAAAHDLYVYEHSVFPGLLQTPRYAGEVLAKWPNIKAEELERRLKGRLMRQEILHRVEPAPPRLWALIDEAALRRPVGTPEVMYEQCMKALEVARLPHVTLGVVPYSAGGHIGLLGACIIVERDGIPRAMNLDDLIDGAVIEDPARLRRAALRFRVLQHEALPGGASEDMIERLAKELWKP
jgi:hypothetical protein